MPKWELFKRNLIFVFLSLAQFFFCIIPFKWLATQFNRTTAAKFSAGMCMVVCYDDASFVCFVDNISLHTYHWLRFDSSTSAQFSFCSWPVTHTHHQKKTANWSLPLVVDPFNAKLIAHSEVFKLWYHKTGSDLLGIVSECPVFMPFKLIECVKHVSSSSALVCVCAERSISMVHNHLSTSATLTRFGWQWESHIRKHLVQFIFNSAQWLSLDGVFGHVRS